MCLLHTHTEMRSDRLIILIRCLAHKSVTCGTVHFEISLDLHENLLQLILNGKERRPSRKPYGFYGIVDTRTKQLPRSPVEIKVNRNLGCHPKQIRNHYVTRDRVWDFNFPMRNADVAAIRVISSIYSWPRHKHPYVKRPTPSFVYYCKRCYFTKKINEMKQTKGSRHDRTANSLIWHWHQNKKKNGVLILEPERVNCNRPPSTIVCVLNMTFANDMLFNRDAHTISMTFP